MLDRANRPTITESVVKSADSAVESADYRSRPTGNWPSGYGPLVSMENNIVYLFEEVVLVLCFAFLLFNFMIFFCGAYE